MRLRGAPLLLSPADFQVAARWQRDGVPLGLVLATLEEVFAKRRERGAAGGSTACATARPRSRRRGRRCASCRGPARRAGGGEELPVGERLGELAAALPAGDGWDAWRARAAALRARRSAGGRRGALRAPRRRAAGGGRGDTRAAGDRERLDAEVERSSKACAIASRTPSSWRCAASCSASGCGAAYGLPVLTLF